MKNHLKPEDILNHWTGDGLRISPLDKNGHNMSSRSVKEHFDELSNGLAKLLPVLILSNGHRINLEMLTCLWNMFGRTRSCENFRKRLLGEY